MKKQIFGISYKYGFGGWEYIPYFFESTEAAQEWLNAEQHDFRTREIVSKTKAIKLAGKRAVEYAMQF